MNNKTIHLKQELNLSIQIIKRRNDLTLTLWREPLASAEIGTMTFSPRFLAIQPLLPNRMLQFSWLYMGSPNSSGQYSGGPLSEITSKESGTQSRLSQSL